MIELRKKIEWILLAGLVFCAVAFECVLRWADSFEWRAALPRRLELYGVVLMAYFSYRTLSRWISDLRPTHEESPHGFEVLPAESSDHNQDPPCTT